MLEAASLVNNRVTVSVLENKKNSEKPVYHSRLSKERDEDRRQGGEGKKRETRVGGTFTMLDGKM
jgi:hypothetical protein